MKKEKKMKKKDETVKPKKIIILERILRFMAAEVLKKYKPKIIGITGSIGKTSTKEAVFSVLSGHFNVRKNEKNYNNEIGLPLTIIGSESGGRLILKWFLVFFKWIGIIIWPIKYPEILVLEMGADRPGDIRYLTGFIKPNVGILTDISSSHLEFFKTLEGVAKEKTILLQSISEDGLAVMNIDNPKIMKIKQQLKHYEIGAKIMTFGIKENAQLQAEDITFNYANVGEGFENKELRGLSFKLNYDGAHIPFRLNNILARHNAYAALSAIAAGLHFGLNLVEIGKGIENFSLPSGRTNLIRGIRNSYLIDDTYNASPVSTTAALELLGEIKGRRKIAVLGDMLELGADMEEGHKAVAKKFLEIKGNIFIAVGRRMHFAAQELEKHNFGKDRLFVFKSPIEAGKKLEEIIGERDFVLIKGSQGMRMEKVVEEVMAEPMRAKDLLCRQSEEWKKKEWREV